MADNTQLNTGTGGDSVRDVDNSLYTDSVPQAVKTQVVKLDQGGQVGESLASPTNPLLTVDENSEMFLLLLQQILTELRIVNFQLQEGFNLEDDLDALRNSGDLTNTFTNID